MNERMVDLLPRRTRGRSAWTVAGRAAVVQHVIGRGIQAELTNTDGAMAHERRPALHGATNRPRRPARPCQSHRRPRRTHTRRRRRAPTRWRCPEPLHPDEHPSVKVFTDRRGVERWRCWSGGHGGTAIDAVIVARNVAVGGAMRWLADNYAHLEPLPRPPRPTPANRSASRHSRSSNTSLAARNRRGPAQVARSVNGSTGVASATRCSQRTVSAPILGAASCRDRRVCLPDGRRPCIPLSIRTAHSRYFQACLVEPPEGRCKYDNPASRWAANPRVAWTKPISGKTSPGSCLVVTEGIADALGFGAGRLPLGWSARLHLPGPRCRTTNHPRCHRDRCSPRRGLL